MEKRLAEQLDLAERYLSELDYESAIAAYEAAIEIEPKCEEAYLGLADIYIEQEEYEKAADILEAGLTQIDSETISSKQGEVEELLAEREKQVEEMLTSADGAPEEGNMLAEEETAAEGEGSVEEETADEEEVSAEEAAAAGSVPYTVEMAAIANASVGDIVYFGNYEQDSNFENGTEPVEWYVLDKADGEATLLSVYLLDCQPYHEDYEDITWENCTLRSWLNSEFYNTAFSAEEQQVIINTNIINEDNPYYGTEGGNDTVDKVWLLSLGEVERYFHINRNVCYEVDNGNMSWEEYAVYCYGQDHRVCAKPMAYAGARGLYAFPEGEVQYYLDEYGIDMSYAVGSGVWLLRSPGFNSDVVAYVNSGGDVFFGGVSVGNPGGVRPALKVAY